MKIKLYMAFFSIFLLACGVSAFAQDLLLPSTTEQSPVIWISGWRLNPAYRTGNGVSVWDFYVGPDRLMAYSGNENSHDINSEVIHTSGYRFFTLPGDSSQVYRLTLSGQLWGRLMTTQAWFDTQLNPKATLKATVGIPAGSGEIDHLDWAYEATNENTYYYGGNATYKSKLINYPFRGGGIYMISFSVDLSTYIDNCKTCKNGSYGAWADLYNVFYYGYWENERRFGGKGQSGLFFELK